MLVLSWVMKGTHVNPMLVMLTIAREPCALIDGKIMWRMEKLFLRL
jgi:hypothetical protein